MKIQIRNGCFETNSSSAHSLVIRKTSDYVTKEEVQEAFEYRINENGEWGHSWDDEYFEFWRAPFRFLEGFENKARYCVANFADSSGVRSQDQKKWDELVEVLKDYLPDFKSIYMPLDDFWEDKHKPDEPKYYNIGCDEHILAEWLDEAGISVREFLTNNKYVIIQDGDEYNWWKDAKHSGLINMNEIERELC